MAAAEVEGAVPKASQQRRQERFTSRRRGCPESLALLMLAFAGFLLLWSRLNGIDNSLWHDEVVTIRDFVEKGLWQIVRPPQWSTNNHISFSLLSYGTTSVLGKGEATYRLWAVVPALSAVGLLAWWVARRFSIWSAAVLVAFVTFSPLHLVLARQARGYGLALFAAALLIVAADDIARRGGQKGLIGFVGAGLIGCLTLPSFLLPFLATSIVLALRKKLRARVGIAVIGVGIALTAAYLPMLTDALGIADQSARQGSAEVDPLSWLPTRESGSSREQLRWHAPVSAPVLILGAPTFDQWLNPDPAQVEHWARTDPFKPLLGYTLLAGFLAAGGAWSLYRRGEGLLAGLLLFPLVGTYFALFIARVYLEPRYTAWLLFHFLILMAVGAAALARHSARVPGVRGVAAVAVVALVAIAGVRLFFVTDQLAELPIENFEEVAEIIDRTDAKHILTNSAIPDGVQYYLSPRRVHRPRPARLQVDLCRAPVPFAYIDHPIRIGSQISPSPDLRCLKARGAVPVRVPQRDRGGQINVWLISGR